MLDNHALDGSRIIDPGDLELADLLLQAAGRKLEVDVRLEGTPLHPFQGELLY